MINRKHAPAGLVMCALWFGATAAHAGLARTSITALNSEIYGVYTTDDPTCNTGLVETVPLSATAQSVDMAQQPTVGVGAVANPINCVVLVMKNQVTSRWAAGTYTSTTSTLSDSVCNAGGSVTNTLCGGNGTAITPSWPSKIQTDMARVGLSMTTSCPASSASATAIVPVFISTNSRCYGNTSFDAAETTCVSSGNTTAVAFVAPGSSGSLNGIKLVAPSVSSSYRFIIDPELSVGNVSGTCRSAAPPRFGFAATVPF